MTECVYNLQACTVTVVA